MAKAKTSNAQSEMIPALINVALLILIAGAFAGAGGTTMDC
jgi:hypothetical protein